jgi:Protein of unknown function (DUF3455)
MNMTIRALSLLLTAGLVTSIAGCAGAPGAAEEQTEEVTGAISEAICPPGVPVALTPPAGQTLKETLTGVGVQVYMCDATTAGGFIWSFVSPQANLLNDDGKLVGTHFIGPTWQGNDGSSVMGSKLAAATVDPTAIPWLLLQGASHGLENGRFSNVTSIQRLSTVGGLAPTDGCDSAHLGSIAQVPYTAQYVFYKAKPRGAVKQCGG